MPYFPITGMRSQRHPFVGFDDFEPDGIFDKDVFVDRPNIFASDDDFELELVGFAADEEEAKAATTEVEKALATGVPAKVPTPEMSWWSPLVSGLFMAAVTYGVTRAADVDKRKSTQVAFVMGGVVAVQQVFGRWLYGKLGEIKESLTTKAT